LIHHSQKMSRNINKNRQTTENGRKTPNTLDLRRRIVWGRTFGDVTFKDVTFGDEETYDEGEIISE
jgi:hypothetical protein